LAKIPPAPGWQVLRNQTLFSLSHFGNGIQLSVRFPANASWPSALAAKGYPQVPFDYAPDEPGGIKSQVSQKNQQVSHRFAVIAG
jgi:hypothetical protein